MNEQTTIHTTTAPVAAPSLLKRISWGAIFAGLIVALVIQLMFTLLGAAIGAAAIEPSRQGAAQTLAIGSAIWLVVTGLISIFIGACVAGRLSGGPTREDGMLHGFVTWGAATLVTSLLLSTAAGALFGGAMGLVGRTFAMGTTEAMGAAPTDSGTVRGTEAAGLVAKDPQLGVALTRMFSQGGAETAERQQVISILVSRHGMTEQQAASTVERWNQQYQQIRAEAEQNGRQIATEAKRGVSQAAFWGFLALFLGAAVSAWGGWAGTASLPMETVVRTEARATT